MTRAVLAIVIGISVLAPRPAFADEHDFELPKSSYWWDGGAVPFLYLPLALNIANRSMSEPPPTPMMFSPMEGGKTYNGGQYPTTMLYVDAAAAGALILAGGDKSRWHHFKGFAQGLAMTSLLTGVAKSTFGRHRPMYDLGTPMEDQPSDVRKSFFSGHSSMTLATATYLGLYARQHIFSRWRGDRVLPWWEGAAYLTLAAAAIAVPYSQYALNRHHASDVITGSLVGAGMSTLFYIYQERRYRKDKRASETAPEPFQFSIVPSGEFKGVTVSGSF
ncbi:MAG: phosphatase PAP2 family protein [Kofleriaceae bacterium]